MRLTPIVRWALSVGGLLAAVVVVAAASLLLGFLPPAGTIPGWDVVTGSTRGGSDDDSLYQMYDGAVPQMRQKGLKEAYQRIYKHGDKRLTVDLFRMGTWQQAKAWYVEQREGNRSASWFKTYDNLKNQGFIAENSGALVGMLWQRQYVAQVGLQGSGGADRGEVYEFLKSISGRIKSQSP